MYCIVDEDTTLKTEERKWKEGLRQVRTGGKGLKTQMEGGRHILEHGITEMALMRKMFTMHCF